MWTGFLIRSTHRLNKRIFFKGNWAAKSNLQSEYLWLKYVVQYFVEKHKFKYVFFRDHIQSVMLQNAAKIRHRVSTIYASLDIAASAREIHLQHMSHSHYVSKENTYVLQDKESWRWWLRSLRILRKVHLTYKWDI